MVFRGCWGRVSRQLSGLLRLLASAICEKGGWKQPSVLQEMKWSQHHSSGTWMQYQLHRPKWWEHEPALARQGQRGGWSRECCLSPAHLPGHQPGSLASGEQPKPLVWERQPSFCRDKSAPCTWVVGLSPLNHCVWFADTAEQAVLPVFWLFCFLH